MSLPKKERSLCYFNAEYLDKKIIEAIAAVEYTHDDVTPSVSSTAFTPRDLTPASTPPIGKSPEPIGLRTLATLPKMTENHNNQNDPQYEETEIFLRMLELKPVIERKQKLGDRLFPKVKVRCSTYQRANLKFSKTLVLNRITCPFIITEPWLKECTS
jgi:hypothetical protein